jgi:hypothetical protein
MEIMVEIGEHAKNVASDLSDLMRQNQIPWVPTPYYDDRGELLIARRVHPVGVSLGCLAPTSRSIPSNRRLQERDEMCLDCPPSGHVLELARIQREKGINGRAGTPFGRYIETRSAITLLR